MRYIAYTRQINILHFIPIIIAANVVNDAQIFHILKEIFFFLSGVAVMLFFSIEISIRGTNRPKQIWLTMYNTWRYY